jgi:hypothetical protein
LSEESQPIWRKARKKPVEIEFREVNPTDCVRDSLTGEVFEDDVEIINTLEGTYIARPKNDFIIRGVHGELYPIKKDIFAKTYDIIGE